jgi:4-hydroxy-tetrahydrodipicolinate synthase
MALYPARPVNEIPAGGGVPVLGGPVVASITPFTAGAADLEPAAWPSLMSMWARAGVKGVFVGGTTGEFPALDLAERRRLLELALSGREKVRAPLFVVAHVGAASLIQAEALTRHARDAGADAVAAVPPHYYPASAADLRDYYRALHRVAAPTPLLAYNIPQRVGNELSAETIRVLANEGTIAGLKDSAPTAALLETLLAHPGRLRIFSGDDSRAAWARGAGAAGLVSGNAAAVPELVVAVWTGTDEASRAQAQERLDRVIGLLGGSLAAFRAVLEARGVPVGPSRIYPRTSEGISKGMVESVLRELPATEAFKISASDYSGGGAAE